MPTQTEQIIALAESIAADIKLLATTKVDHVAGKGLSTEDYSTAEKTKLGTLSSAALPSLPFATTMDIGAIDSATINLTTASGAMSITSLGTAPAGVTRTLIVVSTGPGNKNLIYNATSMILPGAVNLPLVLGTVVTLVSLGGGNWRATNVTKTNGQAVAATPFTGGTLTTALNEAPIGSIAAASTTDLGATNTNTLLLTGAGGVNITALGTASSGTKRTLICRTSGATVMVAGNDLILPSSTDLFLSYGDVVEFVSQGGGVWSCVAYQANGGILTTSRLQVQTTGTIQAVVDIGPNIAGNPRSAPLKFHAGVNMTDPEDGAFEYDGTNLYFTIGTVRKIVTLS